jgi:hypothetical protein
VLVGKRCRDLYGRQVSLEATQHHNTLFMSGLWSSMGMLFVQSEDSGIYFARSGVRHSMLTGQSLRSAFHSLLVTVGAQLVTWQSLYNSHVLQCALLSPSQLRSLVPFYIKDDGLIYEASPGF